MVGNMVIVIFMVNFFSYNLCYGYNEKWKNLNDYFFIYIFCEQLKLFFSLANSKIVIGVFGGWKDCFTASRNSKIMSKKQTNQLQLLKLYFSISG